VLPDSVTAVLHRDRWDAPSVFTWLQQQGNVDDAEMARTFNCGIGMVVIVSKAHAAQAQVQLEAAGERVFAIGDIRARTADEAPTIVQQTSA
jgi:phosphoribosylformylglycinamidine cyclo-ligase